MKDFVCIAIFNFPHEYFILKLKLADEKLHFFFHNETMVGLFPFSSNPFGGIRLMVAPGDVARAKEILDSFNSPSSNLKVV